jgi:hypothetical protein
MPGGGIIAITIATCSAGFQGGVFVEVGYENAVAAVAVAAVADIFSTLP